MIDYDFGDVCFLLVILCIGIVIGFFIYNNIPNAIPTYCLKYIK